MFHLSQWFFCGPHELHELTVKENQIHKKNYEVYKLTHILYKDMQIFQQGSL